MAVGDLDDFIAALGRARLAGEPLPSTLDRIAPVTEADGYEAQAGLAAWLEAHGQGVVAGYKIGATAAHMQELLGVSGPVYGRILSTNVHPSPASFAASIETCPAVECEIAFRIGQDFPVAPVTVAEAASRIASAMAGIEFVENRYGDYRNRPLGLLTADDFFHRACALGARVADWRGLDLVAAAGHVRIDGAEVARGTGGNVMGDPVNAVVWLNARLAQQGTALKAGQIVFTGALAPVFWLESLPARAEIDIEGLGGCAAVFGPAI